MGCHLGKVEPAPSDSEEDDSERSQVRRRGTDLSGLRLSTLRREDLPSEDAFRTLNVRNNYLSDLPDFLKQFDGSLEELHADGNRFASMPAALAHLRRLTYLNISNNPLRNFQVLQDLHGLKTLALSMCDIKSIPKELTTCANLQTLDLSFNDGVAFPPNLASTPVGKSLTSMCIASCSLRGELPSSLRKLPHLSVLDISDNPMILSRSPQFFGGLRIVSLRIRKMGLIEVPAALVSLSHLEDLDISENSLKDVSGFGKLKIKSLNLSKCELTSLSPTFSHLRGTLEELNLSQNPCFAATSVISQLTNLRQLNVAGCNFSSNDDGRDSEWHDIAKLRSLRRIDWCDWGPQEGKSFKPYRTKLPVHVFGMKLTNVNGVKVRNGLFCSDFITSMLNVLDDGFFKIDFMFEPSALWHHIGILKLVKPIGREHFSETCAGVDRVRARVTLSTHRYLFFLAFQAHNLDTPIIPPLDVVAVHMSQMTVSPISYRHDCQRIAGHILDCNYRTMISEGISNEEGIELHRNTWNMVVEWQTKSTGRDLSWLKYDYWAHDGTTNQQQGSNPFTVKSASREEVHPLSGFTAFSGVQLNLDGLVPGTVADYYQKCDLAPYLTTLDEFFRTAEGIIRNEDHFESQGTELWLRYARFLALYAKERISKAPLSNSSRSRQPDTSTSASTDSKHEMDDLLPLMPPTSNDSHSSGDDGLHGGDAGTTATGAASIAQTQFAIVPTLGMRLMLYLHRSAPIRYARFLPYLEIPAVEDISWSQSREHIERTALIWQEVFHETYLRNTSEEAGANRSVDEYNSSALKKSVTPRTSNQGSVSSARRVSISHFDRQDV